MCGKELADADALRSKLRTITQVSAPPDFEAVVRNRIHRASNKSSSWRLRRAWRPLAVWSSPPLLASSLIILVLLGIGTLFSFQWLSLSDRPPRTSSASSSHTAAPAPQYPKDADSAAKLAIDVAAIELNAPSREPTPSAVENVSQVEEEWSPAMTGSPDPEFREYLVPGPGYRKLILRLPDTIRMQYDQPSEEYFIRNVSH